MLNLVSTGKNTQLHSYPDLHTQFTHPHTNGGRQDLHHAPNTNLFVSTNTTLSSFELLRRTVVAASGPAIQRVQKVVLADISCAACSWSRGQEVAIGQSNGIIRFYSIKRADFTPVKFRPASSDLRQAVAQLAYSNCNELLSAVYADGEISLFGLKTSVRTDQFPLDRGSTLVRFHPTRRYSAAVASENGAVTVLDVSTKRPVFADKRAHASPCTDVCWSPADPNVLLSAGYDCVLGVYDVRQRQSVAQIRYAAPFSCVAVAGGGGASASAAAAGSGQSGGGGGGGGSANSSFVAAGTLKGDLCAYDLRSLKAQLAVRQAVHQTQVMRVAFTNESLSSNRSSNRSSSVADATAAGNATLAAVPNILGGRCSMDVRSGRQSLGGGASRRQSIGQSLAANSRPSMAAVTGGGGAEDDDEQSSFNAFLNKCTRVRESFSTATAAQLTLGGGGGSSASMMGGGLGGGGSLTRRDSLLDMEVRPVRFTDISDSELSTMGGGGSRRGSTKFETPPQVTAASKTGSASRRSGLRVPSSLGLAIPEGTDDDDDDNDDDDAFEEPDAHEAASAALSPFPSHVTRRKRADKGQSHAQAPAASPRAILQDKLQPNQLVAPSMSSTINDHASPGLASNNRAQMTPIAGAAAAAGGGCDLAAGAAMPTASDASALLMFDKENMHRASSPIAAAPAAAKSTLSVAQLNRYMDERLAGLEARIEARLDGVADRLETQLRQESVTLQWQLLGMEDLELRQTRHGVEEIYEAVQQLSMSDPFVQQMVALKEENAQLRAQLARMQGAQVPRPLL